MQEGTQEQLCVTVETFEFSQSKLKVSPSKCKLFITILPPAGPPVKWKSSTHLCTGTKCLLNEEIDAYMHKQNIQFAV